MTRCEHMFQVDPKDGQVKCTLCGDFDDEMELPNAVVTKGEILDEFYKSQESFE